MALGELLSDLTGDSKGERPVDHTDKSMSSSPIARNVVQPNARVQFSAVAVSDEKWPEIKKPQNLRSSAAYRRKFRQTVPRTPSLELYVLPIGGGQL
jgi:hypothetical protein